VRFASEAFLAVGLPVKDAATCAQLMARADLQGADGTGYSGCRSTYGASRAAQ